MCRGKLKIVPTYYSSPKLSRLRARPDLHPKQAAAINAMQAQPRANFLFSGVNGCGKTHFAWALYRSAVVARRRTIAIPTAELMRQYREWEIKTGESRFTTDRPSILPDDVKHDRWTLVLDEFDKAKVSEFSARILFELLSAIRDHGQQLIVTTNKSWEQLGRHWSQLDEVYGKSIMTRLQMCLIVEMF